MLAQSAREAERTSAKKRGELSWSGAVDAYGVVLAWSTLARVEQLFAQGAREPGSTRAREQIGRAQRDHTRGLVETRVVGARVDHILAQST